MVGEGGVHLAERQVGVLHLRGEAVTDRYLTVDGPRSTRGADGWLDTGDLGYLVDGEVVICGRVKDVIIMGGRNIYPTDVERVAEGVDGVRAGNAVAVRWTASGGRESFALAVESRQAGDAAEAERIAAEVRSAVTAAIGVRPAAGDGAAGGQPAEDAVRQAQAVRGRRADRLSRADRATAPAGTRPNVTVGLSRRVARCGIRARAADSGSPRAELDQQLDRVGGVLEVDVELLALGGGEVPQHEVGGVHPAGRSADPEAHPQVVLGAQRRRDRPQAVVAALAAAGLHPDGGRRQVEFVVHSDDVGRFDAEEPGQRRGRPRPKGSCTSGVSPAPPGHRRTGTRRCRRRPCGS